MSDPAPPRRFRFSLRSLILFIALISAATGLWYRWGPWKIRNPFSVVYSGTLFRGHFSPDDTKFLILGDKDVHVWDWRSEKPIVTLSPPRKERSYALFSLDGKHLYTMSFKEGLSKVQIAIRGFEHIDFNPGVSVVEVWDTTDWKLIRTDREVRHLLVCSRLWPVDDQRRLIDFVSDEEYGITLSDTEVAIVERRAPRDVLAFPEFWMTVVLAAALVFSLWRDSRIMRA